MFGNNKVHMELEDAVVRFNNIYASMTAMSRKFDQIKSQHYDLQIRNSNLRKELDEVKKDIKLLQNNEQKLIYCLGDLKNTFYKAKIYKVRGTTGLELSIVAQSVCEAEKLANIAGKKIDKNFVVYSVKDSNCCHD